MPRSMDGHGRVSASRPPPTSIRSPRWLRISAAMPGNGLVAEPGLSPGRPGSGAGMVMPGSGSPPPAPLLPGPARPPLVHDGGAPVGRGAVDQVAVAGHPADVRRAPVHVVL